MVKKTRGDVQTDYMMGKGKGEGPMIKKQRVRASLRRVETMHVEEPMKTNRPRCIDPIIRELQPMSFYADASELDVSAVHVFEGPDNDGIALGFVTRQGTVNVTLPLRLARQLADGLHRLVPRLRAAKLRQQDERE
jgi:hypothetical protein